MRRMETRPSLPLARACDWPGHVVEVSLSVGGTSGAPLRATHERIFGTLARGLLAKLEGPMRR